MQTTDKNVKIMILEASDILKNKESKLKQEGVKVMINKYNILLLLLCLLLIGGCENGEKSLPDNPFDTEVLSLRKIITEAFEIYLDQKEIVVGPLHVCNNDLRRETFRTYKATGTGWGDYDVDLEIEVFYGEAKDKTKWRDLESDKYPIIFAKGVLRYYSNVNNVYFHANEIVHVMDKRD